MSKFNIQNRLDEKAISILSDCFMNKNGGKFDLQFHGIKDNTPDTDGFLRLRQPSNDNHTTGDYLNNVVFFQLKGTSKSIKNNSYKCSRRLIDFCKDINLPTILFVVSDIKEVANGQTDAQIYWYHFSNVNIEILNKMNKGKGDITIPNLSPLKTSKGDFVEQFYLHIKNLAKKNQFLDLPKEILDITIDIKDKILLVGSMVYLVGRVTKNEQKNIAKMIGVTNKQLEDILTSLSKQNLIYKSKDVYIFKQTTDETKREVGLSLVYEVISKINLKQMMELFTDHKQKQQIYSNLASVRHPIASDFFKAESVNLIKYVKNNEEILNSLELLLEHAHITPDNAFEIVSIIAKNKKPIKAKTYNLKGFGKMTGKTHKDLINKSLEILDRIKYLKSNSVWKLLLYLYKLGDESLKKEVVKQVEKIAKFNLFALQQIGYKIQKDLIVDISKWSSDKIEQYFDIFQTTLREILSPTFEGHSMSDYRTFTFHSGPLNVSDELKNIRKEVIVLLGKAYRSSKKLSEKVKIIQALNHATHTPHSHLYGPDMEKMVIENVGQIIDFYLEILPTADNELIQDIDEQRVWFFRRYKDTLSEKISKLEEALHANANYNLFKVFVGYEGRLDPDFDYNKEKDFRTKKVEEFLTDINDVNFEDWRKKILSVVQNYSDTDPGGYNYFHIFLQGLGEKKPDLALRLLKENMNELMPFVASILSGIWKSKEQVKAREMISNWTKSGENLAISAFTFHLVGDTDIKLFSSVYEKSKDKKDFNALNNIVRTIVQIYSKHPDDLKYILIDAIEALSSNNNFWWTNQIWFKVDEVFGNFSEADFEKIIKSLLHIENIDYQVESMLKPVAERYPLKIISLLHDRIKIKTTKKQNISDRYDAIPYDLQQLSVSLRKHESEIIPIILSWYKEGGKKHQWLYKWEASQLLEKLFPGFNQVLESTLIKLVDDGDKESREIIFSVIGKYEGQDFLWGLVSALVNKYKDTNYYKEVRDSLLGYLSQTGVVSGEDGFVKAYQEKKKSIQNLKKDPVLATFVQEYEDYLDIRIRDEQKRTDEGIELMKRGIR